MPRVRDLLISAVAIGAIGYTAGSLTTAPSPAHEHREPQLAAAEGQETGSSIDTCTLLTEADASASLGIDVTVVADPGQCTYVAVDASGRAVSVAAPDAFGRNKDFQAAVDITANAMDGSAHELAVGDEAYAIVSSMASQGLARVGDTFVAVVLTAPTGTTEEQVNQLTTLLQTAVERL